MTKFEYLDGSIEYPVDLNRCNINPSSSSLHSSRIKTQLLYWLSCICVSSDFRRIQIKLTSLHHDHSISPHHLQLYITLWLIRTAYSGWVELNKLQQCHHIYVIRLLFNDSKHDILCRNTQIYFMAYACRSAERFNGMYGCS